MGLLVPTKTLLIGLQSDICSTYFFKLPTVSRLGAELTVHNSVTRIQKHCYNLMDFRDIKTDSCVCIIEGSLLTNCSNCGSEGRRINLYVFWEFTCITLWLSIHVKRLLT
jgi:hypothetical protein